MRGGALRGGREGWRPGDRVTRRMSIIYILLIVLLVLLILGFLGRGRFTA